MESPKQKAEKLIHKYVEIQEQLDEQTTYYWDYACNCALIAVKEILWFIISDLKWDEQTNGNVKYWQEVESEIKMLQINK